jgi:cytidylate kinase
MLGFNSSKAGFAGGVRRPAARLAIGKCPCQSGATWLGKMRLAHGADKGPVIAVDGPAASGKGTIAKALAKHFGLPHMDTGLLYRAVALNLWRWGGDPANEFEARRACTQIGPDPDDPELRSEPVSKIASAISGYASVRAALIERQQEFAAQPGGAVLDGRDIGTVVAQTADVKLFVDASPEVRAKRRLEELMRRGMHAHYEDVLADIRARDDRDSTRENAPLRQASDAFVIDTSDLNVEQAIATAVRLAEEKLQRP